MYLDFFDLDIVAYSRLFSLRFFEINAINILKFMFDFVLPAMVPSMYWLTIFCDLMRNLIAERG